MNKKVKIILLLILAVSFILRIYQINYPNSEVFDEVYYPFTAKEYLKGNTEAWLWSGKAPEGNAIAWVNPPLAQEIMAGSMFILRSTDPWAWRVPSVIFGIFAIYLVFYLGRLLFKDDRAALLSAFIFSIDGLNFVQSRVGMIEIYLVTFILLSLIFFLKRNFFLSAVFLGLALGTKWTAIYLFGMFLILIIFDLRIKFKTLKLKDLSLALIARIGPYILITPAIYMMVYLPFFLTGHTLIDFKELLRQEWHYHLNLKATHDFASNWWSWPLNLYPVWYYVEYPVNKIANIFASGNPILFWLGSTAILLTLLQIIKDLLLKNKVLVTSGVLIALLGFFIFWLPWAASPRIMFLYYFAPSVPFLSLVLGYKLFSLMKDKKDRPLFYSVLVLLVIGFILVYPFLVGIPLPKDLVEFFFFTNLTKNPF